MATPDELYAAREERNQAWSDRMKGRISDAELFAILRRIRQKYGQAIYSRQMIDECDG